MGMIHAEIELINEDDLSAVRRGNIGHDEVRCITINALVDTGAAMLAINENIQEYLQLPVRRTQKSQMANGQIIECPIVGPVELKFKNRQIGCWALVLPGDSEPLLGYIPLEEMDVMIHPNRQELIVNPDHPDFAVLSLKGMPRPRGSYTLVKPS
jgi:clan AA aspartic protease